MKRFLLSLAIPLLTYPACGQTMTDVQSMLNAVKSTTTVLATITAQFGDGTVCTITKFAGSVPHVGLKCVPGDAKSLLTQANLTLGSTLQTLPFGYGDVLCLVAVNPTGTAITLGSMGTVPAVGMAWQCSSNIESATTGVTGQTSLVSGTATWP
jgi:hypothetical protein